MPDLLQIYHSLLDHHGPRNWWPADTPFEVAVGAILTQNTNWNNVEKAISNLHAAAALDCETICSLPRNDLEQLIRPSGFFRQKAERLQLFCRFLQQHHNGDLNVFLGRELAPLREELLALKGVGPETADSILLYAGQRLSFVIDAYTRRLFMRLGCVQGNESYAQLREMFMTQLRPDVALYNEYHALIVIHCKDFCRKKPLCASCPLGDICLYSKEIS